MGAGWINPPDFWRLTPGELFMLIEAKAPKRFGDMSEDDVAELYDIHVKHKLLQEVEARG